MPEGNSELIELKGLVQTMRTEHETAQEKNLPASEFKEKFDKMSADFLALTDRIAEAEVKLKRPQSVVIEEKKESIEHKTMFDHIRRGKENLGPEEQKVMRLADDTLGGYLTAPDIDPEIIKASILFSPIRSIAKVRTTGKSEVWARKRTGTLAAQWVAETGTKAETTGWKFGLEKIPNFELYADVAFSNADLEDSDYNLDAEFNLECGEQFGVAEGLASVSGSGVGKMEGIFVNAAVLAAKKTTATKSVLALADIMAVFYGLKQPYAANGTWIMNRGILPSLTLFVNTAGFYVWMPPMGVGAPSVLLGRPIVEFPDMPAAVADGAYVLAFGDFARGYMMVDRMGIAVLRDPYTLKLQGQVEFTARKRVGGQVVLAEAISALMIKAT